MKDMNLTPEAARFVPLVKSLAAKTYHVLLPERDEQDLVNWGLRGLTEGLAQFKSRQGLTQREFLIYKIRGAIYAGLTLHSWSTDETRQKYLFLKKTNELLLNFHLSAEGTIKRSIKAEEEEVVRLLALLAMIGFLCTTTKPNEANGMIQELDSENQQFLHLYYEQDLELPTIAQQLKMTESAAARFHLRTLEQLANKFCREYKG
jgi:DNA-directed RNA polymerase specialized sigma subunit